MGVVTGLLGSIKAPVHLGSGRSCGCLCPDTDRCEGCQKYVKDLKDSGGGGKHNSWIQDADRTSRRFDLDY